MITRLGEYGVQTRTIWGLINEQLPYRNEIAYEIEKAPYYASCILNIPSSTQITRDDIIYTTKCINAVLEEVAI